METTKEKVASFSDEIFTEAIRRYPVLYDKYAKGYKDTSGQKMNAWEKVVAECCLADVASAQQLFENIKKKFNVRRKNSKGPSGSGAADMSAQQEDFKDMAYLSWLAPFVKLRQTKSRLPPSPYLISSSYTKNQNSLVREVMKCRAQRRAKRDNKFHRDGNIRWKEIIGGGCLVFAF